MNADPNFKHTMALVAAPAPANTLMANARWGWYNMMMHVMLEHQEAAHHTQQAGHPAPVLMQTPLARPGAKAV